VLTDGKTTDVTTARSFSLPPGSIVALDRAYCDFELFYNWNSSGVFFVTRLKGNAAYQVVKNRRIPKNSNVRADQIIRFTGPKTSIKYPGALRRVVVWDEQNNRDIELLTNHINFGATTISKIYRDRWQIELFFKVLKHSTSRSRPSSAQIPTLLKLRFGQHLSPSCSSSICSSAPSATFPFAGSLRCSV
jgi:IS4 transposase